MPQLGVIGLGTMGANLARNAARNGTTVVVFNRTNEKTKEFIKNFGKEGTFIETSSLEEFVKALDPPRVILLMVKAGEALDEVLSERISLLSKGDIVIDGGNSHYKDTERREKMLTEKGVQFIGMGVSGGEEGALLGPSMMPGGKKEVYEKVSELLTKMAADDGAKGKCVTHIGPGGAGHFVKMVHNGIEYGLMQLLAESYHILKGIGGLSNAELAKLYAEWNKDPLLESFLIEITAKIFAKKEDNKDLIDLILDKAGQKGTGKWTTDAAMSYGVAVPIITSAVDARIISAGKDFRVGRSKEITASVLEFPIDKKALLEEVKTALTLSFIATYAEGFLLMSVAGNEEKWHLNIPEIARIWRGGCIIRSKILGLYQKMFTGDQKTQMELRSLFEDDNQKVWRKVVTTAIAKGIPVPAMSAALISFDGYRSSWLPQNLIQAQRDFFGAHTFERTDKSGMYHEQW